MTPERYCPVCHEDVPCKVGLELGHYHYAWVKLNVCLQCAQCGCEIESDSATLDYSQEIRIRATHDP